MNTLYKENFLLLRNLCLMAVSVDRGHSVTLTVQSVSIGLSFPLYFLQLCDLDYIHHTLSIVVLVFLLSLLVVVFFFFFLALILRLFCFWFSSIKPRPPVLHSRLHSFIRLPESRLVFPFVGVLIPIADWDLIYSSALVIDQSRSLISFFPSSSTLTMA